MLWFELLWYNTFSSLNFIINVRPLNKESKLKQIAKDKILIKLHIIDSVMP